MDSAEFIPRSFRRAVKAFDMNWGPLSEMILFGSSNRLYKCSSKSRPVSSEVNVLLQAMRITPFERPWSTMTKRELKPSANGRSVIKSIEQ